MDIKRQHWTQVQSVIAAYILGPTYSRTISVTNEHPATTNKFRCSGTINCYVTISSRLQVGLISFASFELSTVASDSAFLKIKIKRA